MIKKQTILTLLFPLLFSTGCVSTASVHADLSNKFMGKNLDSFVMRNGVPKDKHLMSNGYTMYTWSSDIATGRMPTTYQTTGTYDGFNMYSNTTSMGGAVIQMFCKINLMVDQKNIIKDISILNDTSGSYTTSKCYEVLN